ncbi:ABC transporter permease [Paenibacillus arenilitoris]|uniref:ABC transporter permease n=1 Tax=Paenibacillus arenilitoris TaxID=2772299 RepID=A0A927CJ44_9BACL|nr:ABC transporter permease [Paenibacillus arenilitoris]MBD2869039.1 ABC transporter permease [Paenibacillus arenilitoris]
MKHWNFRLRLGVVILAAFIVLGFVVPLFSPVNPIEWGTYLKNLKPSGEHPFGTTNLGQDTFWLLAKSVQNSFLIGILVAFFATLIGALLGLWAGFKGGFADRLITVLTDSFIVIPTLPILILLGSLMQGKASLLMIAAVLIIFNWPWPARQLRSMALSLSERDFISTALFSGQSTLKIIVKEIFPFVAGWSVANFINTILVAIGAESGLAVIGMSSNEQATLGTMIYWANQHQAMLAGRWWWIGSPVAAIALIFIALFLVMTGYQQYSALRRGK